MRGLGLLPEVYQLVRRVSRKKQWERLGKRRGQKHSVWAVMKLYLAYTLSGWSRHMFYQKRKIDKAEVLRHLGLANRLPSESQQGKREASREFLLALMGVLSESAAQVLRRLGPEEVRITMMDLTSVPSSRTDRQAGFGTDGETWFNGYKLGILTSRSGVVMGVALVTANLGERHACGALIRMARGVLNTEHGEFPVQYLLCDAGFAGEATYRQAHRELKCRVVMPPQRKVNPKRRGRSAREYMMRRRSPHRYRDWRFWRTPTAKRLYRERKEIERRLAQLTDDPLHVDRRPRCTVGVPAVLRWELGRLILWNVGLNQNIVNRRPLRALKVLMA